MLQSGPCARGRAAAVWVGLALHAVWVAAVIAGAAAGTGGRGGQVMLWIWLEVLDVLAWLGLFGSPLYLWVVRRASDCVVWA